MKSLPPHMPMDPLAVDSPPRARVDTLSGDYVIFQPEAGQRYTTDDMLAAWLAVETLRDSGLPATVFLDLGSGLCSVPMILLWSFPSLRGLGVELRRERLMLGRQSLAANGLLPRFRLVRGDVRTAAFRRRFPLVTSSPPYYGAHQGPVSPDSEKAAARFELNGTIEDYFRCAAEHLACGGFFVTVYPRRYAEKAFRAAEQFRFSLDRRVDVFPGAAKPPLIALLAFVWDRPGRNSTETLTVRTAGGGFSEQYRTVRKQIGFPEPR